MDYSHKWGNFQPLINLANIYKTTQSSRGFRFCWIYAGPLHCNDQETGSLNCIRIQPTRFISLCFFFRWWCNLFFGSPKEALSKSSNQPFVRVGILEKGYWQPNKALWMRMYESPPLVWGAWEFPEYISVDGKQKLGTQWYPNGKHGDKMWTKMCNFKHWTTTLNSSYCLIGLDQPMLCHICWEINWIEFLLWITNENCIILCLKLVCYDTHLP